MNQKFDNSYSLPPATFLPVYQDLVRKEADIYFLWGGRDSGKSHFIAQKLLLDCVNLKYFKCILIKKTAESIKDSQWQLVHDLIILWGLEEHFTCHISPLEIICNINGNKFIARGCDNPAKLKSITNPTHAWYEEGNQLTEQDHITVSTTLRSNKGKIKEWFSFNPECDQDYESFWLYKNYFKEKVEAGILSFDASHEFLLPNGKKFELKYTSKHSTYQDNKYCSIDRIARHELLKTTNSYYYQTFTKGLWSIHSNGGSFLKSFSIAKHVKPIEYNPNIHIHVSIDNNVFPYISVSVFQVQKEFEIYKVRQIKELPAIDPNNTVTQAANQLIKWLKTIGYNQTIYLYGDRSTKSRNTIDDNKLSFAQKFINTLTSSGFKVVDKMLNFAPSVSMIGDFVNEILAGNLPYAEIEIDSNCRLSINDYIVTKQDKDGTILKKRVIDKNKGISYEPNGHICFVGETLIRTNLGLKRIDEIKIGDNVLTRNGYKRVVNTFKNGIHEVKKYKIGNKIIECTENHKIWTKENGFIEVKYLIDQKIFCIFADNLKDFESCKEKLLFTMEKNSIGILNQQSGLIKCIIQDISKLMDVLKKLDYMFINGFVKLAKYPAVIVSIIKTAIHLIMNYQTYNVLIQKNTCRSTCQPMSENKKAAKSWKTMLGQKQLNGINQMQVGSGTKNMLKWQYLLSHIKRYVLNAMNHLKLIYGIRQSFAVLNINGNTKQENKGQKKNLKKKQIAQFVESKLLVNCIVQDHVITKEVYNIEVEDVHEYFANDVLVSNCDNLKDTILSLFYPEFKKFQTRFTTPKQGGITFTERTDKFTL